MPTSTDEKLDQIVGYLEEMNKRDRLRTIGGTIKGVIAVLPILVFLAGTWYMIKHGDELLEKISRSAAETSIKYSRDNMDRIMLDLGLGGSSSQSEE